MWPTCLPSLRSPTILCLIFYLIMGGLFAEPGSASEPFSAQMAYWPSALGKSHSSLKTYFQGCFLWEAFPEYSSFPCPPLCTPDAPLFYFSVIEFIILNCNCLL